MVNLVHKLSLSL